MIENIALIKKCNIFVFLRKKRNNSIEKIKIMGYYIIVGILERNFGKLIDKNIFGVVLCILRKRGINNA